MATAITLYWSVNRILLIVLLVFILSGCNSLSRIADIGKAPDLAPITNPTHRQGYQPISMPMPNPEEPASHANSLWRTGAQKFFGDQRAKQVGDILTVTIAISDEAAVANSTSRTRSNTESMNAPSLFGYEDLIGRYLPNKVEPDPDSLFKIGSNVNNTGAGNISRGDKITLTVAAVVVQVLPNGNMVIEGRQESRVNFEVREIIVAGIIRPEDITTANTIEHTKIAEARIAYGGRGQITDVQQPRYGSQVMDILLPF